MVRSRGWWMLLPLLLWAANLGAAGDTRLVEAAKKADKAAVRTLLKQGADVNAPYADGATALHWAAHWNDLEMADLLIRAGARVNAANDLGATPLWVASINGSAEMIERMVKAGANPNTTLPSGETPLMTAARTGNVGAVKWLLANGAHVNAQEYSRGQTALMWAVAEKRPDVVKLLVDMGADTHIRSHVRTQIVNTTGNADASGVIEIEQGGYTALMFAAQMDELESARLLLAAGADANETAPVGTSALVIAAHSDSSAVATLLLDKGADPNAGGAGYTALHAAVLRGNLDLVKALLAHGANPNTPVEKATQARRVSVDFALSKAVVGTTPFWMAAKFIEPGIMRVLAANGANPSFAKDGTTPLMIALQRGFDRGRYGIVEEPSELERRTLEAVTVAADLGADVNAVDDAGNTALHGAASQGFNASVQFLVERGANLEAKNKKGQTPLALTTASGPRGAGPDRKSTSDLLRKLGAKE